LVDRSHMVVRWKPGCAVRKGAWNNLPDMPKERRAV